jgi:hypothetical protein
MRTSIWRFWLVPTLLLCGALAGLIWDWYWQFGRQRPLELLLQAGLFEWVKRPLRRLQIDAESAAKDLSQEVHAHGSGEFEPLFKSVRTLVDTARQQVEMSKEHAAHLARTAEDAARRADALGRVHKMATELTGVLDVERLVRSAVGHVPQIVECDLVTLGIHDPLSGDFVCHQYHAVGDRYSGARHGVAEGQLVGPEDHCPRSQAFSAF